MRFFRRVLARRERPTVQIMFVQVPDHTPGNEGADTPIIGIVETDDEARQVEASCTDHGVEWEEVRLHPDPEGPLPDTLWVALTGGVFEDEARLSPSPQGAFLTLDDARDWARREGRSDADTLLWEVPLGRVDVAAPAWPAARFDPTAPAGPPVFTHGGAAPYQRTIPWTTRLWCRPPR